MGECGRYSSLVSQSGTRRTIIRITYDYGVGVLRWQLSKIIGKIQPFSLKVFLPASFLLVGVRKFDYPSTVIGGWNQPVKNQLLQTGKSFLNVLTAGRLNPCSRSILLLT